MPDISELNTSKSLLLRLKDLQDQEAWNNFVDRYGPEIYRWCKEFNIQESDALDLTQEVLAKLVATMRSFEYDVNLGTFRGWLKTVTKNAVRDLGKKWERRITGSGETAINNYLLMLAAPEALNTLEMRIEAQYEAELLAEAERLVSHRVQPKTWRAFQMVARQQIPVKQVAKELAMPISDIYVAKSRVLKMLREEVSKLNADHPNR